MWLIEGFFVIAAGFQIRGATRSTGRKRYRHIAGSIVTLGTALMVALVTLGVDGVLLAPVAFIIVVPAALYYKISASKEQ